MDLYSIQAMIREVTGAPYVLAGGCVRDASAGATPKDYDAVLCIGPYMADAAAFAMIEAHVKAFRTYHGADAEVYMAYGIGDVPNGFQERLYCCGKVTLGNGTQIDLLLDRASTIEEAVAHYDTNMNQVYLLDGGAGPSREFPASLEFNPARITDPKRDAYMQAKFLTLTNQ